MNDLPQLDDRANYTVWKTKLKAQLMCEANEDLHTPILIRSLSDSILKDLAAKLHPKELTEQKFSDLIKALDELLNKPELDLAKKARLFELRQRGTTLEEFMSTCRHDANSCDWTDFKEKKAAILAFIIGLDDTGIRRHLLMAAEGKSATEILNMARICETSTKDAQTIGRSTSYSNQVKQRNPNFRTRRTTNNDSHQRPQSNSHTQNCCFCKGPHSRKECTKAPPCPYCHKKDHAPRTCPNRRNRSPSHTRAQSNTIHVLHTSTTAQLIPPVMIPISVQDRSITFEYDSGSPLTLIDRSTWQLLGKPRLSPCRYQLCGITGDHLNVLGQFRTTIHYGNETKRLILTVHSAPTRIIGRDWIHALGTKLIDATTKLLLGTEAVHSLRSSSMKLTNAALSEVLRSNERMLKRQMRILHDLLKPTSMHFNNSTVPNNKQPTKLRIEEPPLKLSTPRRSLEGHERLYVKVNPDAPWEPAKLVKNLGRMCYIVRTDNGKNIKKHLNQLRIRHIDRTKPQRNVPLDETPPFILKSILRTKQDPPREAEDHLSDDDDDLFEDAPESQEQEIQEQEPPQQEPIEVGQAIRRSAPLAVKPPVNYAE